MSVAPPVGLGVPGPAGLAINWADHVHAGVRTQGVHGCWRTSVHRAHAGVQAVSHGAWRSSSVHIGHGVHGAGGTAQALHAHVGAH